MAEERTDDDSDDPPSADREDAAAGPTTVADDSDEDGEPTEAAESAAADGVEDSGGWLVLSVLVVGVLSMLLVGALLDAPVAERTTEFAIGFVWLLAAAYVGFRMEGRPGRRLLGATAFVAAAVVRFVGLLFPSGFLDLASIAFLLVGAVVLLSVARE